ncbi:MAG: hypothetical protein ACW968_07380 [Candidatus Thorarchaeota archaeon]|jgi:hypothetical protein
MKLGKDILYLLMLMKKLDSSRIMYTAAIVENTSTIRMRRENSLNQKRPYHPLDGVQYAEVGVPGEGTYCNYRNCSCSGSKIEPDDGYLFLSKDFVKFRMSCITILEFAELRRKMDFKKFKLGKHTPTLVCERGAYQQNRSTEIARIDAIYWWKTGLVPLRETPKK